MLRSSGLRSVRADLCCSAHSSQVQAERLVLQRSQSTLAPKPRRTGRRLLVGATLLTAAVYGGGTYASLSNPRFKESFVELPGAQQLVDAFDSEKQMIEEIREKQSKRPQPARKPKPIMPPPTTATGPAPGPVSATSPTSPTKATDEAKAKASGEKLPPALDETKKAASNAAHSLGADRATQKVEGAVEKAAAKADDVVQRAEKALGLTSPSPADLAEPARPTKSSKQAYDGTLPLGFEPPPGYSAPKAADRLAEKLAQKGAPPIELPRIAPKLAKTEEPVLGELAKTIDSLGSYLRQRNPDGDKAAVKVLSSAEEELKQLGQRFGEVRQAEQKKLAEELERQAHAHLEDVNRREREAIMKGDKLESELKAAFDDERRRLTTENKAKLDAQLEQQRELIETRLREEVLAQGVEMQRRWLREVQNHVETERSGRLGKLDQLESSLGELEKIADENTHYLDDALSVHGLLGALRAASSRPGKADELALLREVAQKAGAVASGPVLSTLPHAQAGGSDVYIERGDALRTWFTSRVAPRIRLAALLPEGGGCVSYLFSSLLSPLLLRRQGSAAVITGEQDVASVLARAEWYLTVRQDIDAAAREVNALKGWPKILVRDWLEAARRHLELDQALRVVEAEASLRAVQVL